MSAYMNNFACLPAYLKMQLSHKEVLDFDFGQIQAYSENVFYVSELILNLDI